MSDCDHCNIEPECGYEYKPCDCVQQRKFKPLATHVMLGQPLEQVGLLLVGQRAREEFVRFTCSCGSAVSYPLNGIPEVDTPMPCGNPRHWAVRFEP